MRIFDIRLRWEDATHLFATLCFAWRLARGYIDTQLATLACKVLVLKPLDESTWMVGVEPFACRLPELRPNVLAVVPDHFTATPMNDGDEQRLWIDSQHSEQGKDRAKQ